MRYWPNEGFVGLWMISQTPRDAVKAARATLRNILCQPFQTNISTPCRHSFWGPGSEQAQLLYFKKQKTSRQRDKQTNKQEKQERTPLNWLTFKAMGTQLAMLDIVSCWGDPVQLINVKIQELTFRFPCGQDQTWYEVVKDNESWLELKLYKVLKVSLDEMTKSEIIRTTNSAKMHKED